MLFVSVTLMPKSAVNVGFSLGFKEKVFLYMSHKPSTKPLTALSSLTATSCNLTSLRQTDGSSPFCRTPRMPCFKATATNQQLIRDAEVLNLIAPLLFFVVGSRPSFPTQGGVLRQQDVSLLNTGIPGVRRFSQVSLLMRKCVCTFIFLMHDFPSTSIALLTVCNTYNAVLMNINSELHFKGSYSCS